MKSAAGSSCAFVGLVALVACSAPESPPRPLAVSVVPSVSGPAVVRASAAPSAVASALPEASSAPLSSEPPEDDMVDVPAGSFWMGCAKGDPDCRDDEKPRHKVTLRAFQIDRLEVTVQQFRTCLQVGACEGGEQKKPKECNINLAGRDRHGMNCVDRGEAHDYCKWLNKRLPTEAEWERAARGTDDRIHPWGNELPNQARLCLPKGASCPVGSFPDGASPTGALDMGGNLAEWVSDTYLENYYSRSPAKNPQGPDPIRVSTVLYGCGGGHTCSAARGDSARMTERWGAEGHAMIQIGFRCARSASQKPSVAP